MATRQSRNGGSRRKKAVVDEATELNSKQLRAVELLAIGRTVPQVAKVVEKHRATIYIWLKKPEFRAALNQARREHWQALRASAMDLVRTAVRVIKDELKGKNLDATQRVETALKILGDSDYLSGAKPTIGPTDPDELRNKDRSEAQFRRLNSRMLENLELQEVLVDSHRSEGFRNLMDEFKKNRQAKGQGDAVVQLEFRGAVDAGRFKERFGQGGEKAAAQEDAKDLAAGDIGDQQHPPAV